MKRGDVYWLHFPDPSTGSEIAKTRPAVILTADPLIGPVRRVQVVPFTSHIARVFSGEAIVTIRSRQSKALASQLTTADESRVLGYVASLSPSDLAAVEHAVRQQLSL